MRKWTNDPDTRGLRAAHDRDIGYVNRRAQTKRARKRMLERLHLPERWPVRLPWGRGAR